MTVAVECQKTQRSAEQDEMDSPLWKKDYGGPMRECLGVSLLVHVEMLLESFGIL